MVPGLLLEGLLFDPSLAPKALVLLAELSLLFKMWCSVDIPWSPRGDMIPSVLFTPPRRAKRILALWRGSVLLAFTVAWHLSNPSPCVWSLLWILQPPFAEGPALCRSLVVLGRDWSEALIRQGAEEGKNHSGWDRKLLQPPSPPPPGKNTNISSSCPPPHKCGVAKTACLNSRGWRVTPSCATDSPTSGWETAQQCCSN